MNNDAQTTFRGFNCLHLVRLPCILKPKCMQGWWFQVRAMRSPACTPTGNLPSFWFLCHPSHFPKTCFLLVLTAKLFLPELMAKPWLTHIDHGWGSVLQCHPSTRSWSCYPSASPCHEAAILQPVGWSKEHPHHKPQLLAHWEHCTYVRALLQSLGDPAGTLPSSVPISWESTLRTPKGGNWELHGSDELLRRIEEQLIELFINI